MMPKTPQFTPAQQARWDARYAKAPDSNLIVLFKAVVFFTVALWIIGGLISLACSVPVVGHTVDAVSSISSGFWILLAVLAGIAFLGWLAWLARKAIAALLLFLLYFIIGVVIVKIILFFLFVVI